jgi:hypothetical protein
MDVRAARGTGGVVGVAWGATEVVDTTQGTVEVYEASDEGAAKGRAV